MRRDWFVCLLLVLATLVVYGQVVRHDFVNFDDNEYVYENPHVRDGLDGKGVAWAFTTMRASNWHPLTWLSHMLDCELFGLRAGYHHLTNLLLHVLVTLLLYLVLSRMTGTVWRSAMVAALFALHPLHVESVAWVSERKDVLSGVFFMLTIRAYAVYAVRPSLPRYGLVVSFLALGLMAKPMLVTLPFVLLLLDVWPLGRLQFAEKAESDEAKGKPGRNEEERSQAARKRIEEKLPLFALAVASSVVTVFAQQRGGAMSLSYAVPLTGRIQNALMAYVGYLGKAFWPVHLAVYYPYRAALPAAQYLGVALVLAGISILVLRAGRRRPYLAVGWFWYLGMLVPVIGLVQVGAQSMADRYTYLPLIGIFLMVVWGLADLVAGWRRARLGLTVVAGLAILGCVAITFVQIGYWRSGKTLFDHALKVTDSNALAHNNLGNVFMNEGNLEEAIVHYQEAVRITPRYETAHVNLAAALIEQGKPDEARLHCELALRVNAGYAKAHNTLGLILAGSGKREEAIACYREALRIEPDYADAHSNLGIALMAKGNPEEALRHCRESVRIDPTNKGAYNNLGVVLMGQGKHQEAARHYRKALGLDPQYTKAQGNLTALLVEQGIVLAGEGRLGEALHHFREALALNPELSAAHISLGLALASQGEFKAAVSHYEEAIRLDPGDPRPHNNLAWILGTHPDPGLRDGAEAVRLAERACELSIERDAHFLDTLAAAYAEAGRYPEAIAAMKEAITAAESGGLEALTPELAGRLQSYKAGVPYRESLAGSERDARE